MESIIHIKYIINRIMCLSYHQGIFHLRYCISYLKPLTEIFRCILSQIFIVYIVRRQDPI